MPSRGFVEPPQTLRAAKRAYAKRGGSLVSEEERRRIARAAELDRRAEAIRRKEEQKKENKRKRDEKEEREKEKRRRMGTETALAKLEEGQQGIMNFFKGTSLVRGRQENKPGKALAKDLCEQAPRTDPKEDTLKGHPGLMVERQANQVDVELAQADVAEVATLEDVCDGASQISIHEQNHQCSQDAKPEPCEEPCLKIDSDDVKDNTDEADPPEKGNAANASWKVSDQISHDTRSNQHVSGKTTVPALLEAETSNVVVTSDQGRKEKLQCMPPPTTPRIQKKGGTRKTASPRKPLQSVSHNPHLRSPSDAKLPLPVEPMPTDWADFFLSNTQVEREITASSERACHVTPTPNLPPPVTRLAPASTTEVDEFSSFLDELSADDLDSISVTPAAHPEVTSVTDKSKRSTGSRLDPARHMEAENQKAPSGKGITLHDPRDKGPGKLTKADDDSFYSDLDWTDEELASLGA